MTVKVSVVVLMTALSTLLSSQISIAASADKAHADWDTYVERVRSSFNNVGLAVAVVQGDKLVYARGFGVRQAGKPDAVTADTLFQIGSTTKAFTAAAIGVLVDQGRIRWDDTIVAHLPGFQLQDSYVTRHLTVRDALTHRSGIPDSLITFMSAMDGAKAVEQLRYVGAVSEFRDSFNYNNLMYATAGKALEHAAGASWDEVVKRQLFEPLKMKRSGTSPYQYWDSQYVGPAFYGSAESGVADFHKAHDGNVAMPHGLDAQGAPAVLSWASFDSAAPAGSIVSSAAEMANWLIMNVNDGKFQGIQVLTAQTVRELHRIQNIRLDNYKNFPIDRMDGYAMGWFKGEYRGRAHLSHSGGMLGFPAYVAMLPEQKIGVIVLSNGPQKLTDDFKTHRAIAFWLMDRLLHEPVRDWSGELLAQMQSQDRARQDVENSLRQGHLNVPASLPLDKYAGTYEEQKLHSGPVAVHVDKGTLQFSFGEHGWSGVLEHWHDDIFRLHTNMGGYDLLAPEFVEFIVDPFGKAKAMSISTAFFSWTLDRIDTK